MPLDRVRKVTGSEPVPSGCRSLGAGVTACGPRHYEFPCECGPDYTGEAPDERPWCPQHGIIRFLTPLLGKPYCQAHDEIPQNCWERHMTTPAQQPETFSKTKYARTPSPTGT